MSDETTPAAAEPTAPAPNPSEGSGGLDLQGYLDAKRAARGEPAAAEAPEPAEAAEPEAEATEPAEPSRDVLDLLLDDAATLTPEQLAEATTINRKMRREQRKQARRIERRESEIAEREKTLAENLDLLKSDAAAFMDRHGFDIRKWALSEVERETATPEQKRIAELEAKIAALAEQKPEPDTDAGRAEDTRALAAHFEDHVDDYASLAQYEVDDVAEAACQELYSYHEKTGRVLTAEQVLRRVARRAEIESELETETDAEPRKPETAEPGGAVDRKPPPTATNRAASARTRASTAAATPAERKQRARELAAQMLNGS
jgi:hypothetical protein